MFLKRHCFISSFENSELAVVDDSSMITSQLVYAFAIAICLHVIPCILFKITPVEAKPEVISPPIIVGVQLEDPSHSPSRIFITPEKEHQDILLETLHSFSSSLPPILGEDLLFQRPHHFIAHAKPVEKLHKFSSDPTWETFFDLSSPRLISISYSPLQVKVSGNLLKPTFPLAIQSLQTAIETQNELQKLVTQVDIRVDAPTGRVFWAAIKKSSHDEDLDQLALEISEFVQFAPDLQEMILTGTVDFLFTIDPQHFQPKQWLKEFQQLNKSR